jgi:indole-3-glycerol phosphate synthase
MTLQNSEHIDKNFLDEILVSKRQAVEEAKGKEPLSDLKRRIRDAELPRDFERAISLPVSHRIHLVAEIKQASPSKGMLRQKFKPVEIGREYEEAGASALSVLTEERFFKGSLQHIRQIRTALKLPILRKDFIMDEYQIFEARAYEADAILFIVALLDNYQLKDFTDIATGLGLGCLVEVHAEEEVEKVLGIPVGMIGINNRDLKTFQTDLEVTFKLLNKIPDERTVVAESGIRTRQDVQRLQSAGLDAVLIGETFMKSPDIRAKIRELFGEA